MNIVFLIGSPRSGTTILGEVLGLHPDIAYWYEPTFIFDRFFRAAPHDRRTAQDATPKVCQYIRSAFVTYERKRGRAVIVEKSPRHSLKIPFLRAIFPDAKFIHLVRHGGDTTLSIFREWEKRDETARRLISLKALNTLRNHVLDQDVLRFRLMALRFQLGESPMLPGQHVYRTRWNGRIGWGPRFEGWEQVIDQVSRIEFNAMQWVHCVETALDDLALVEAERVLSVRYEDFITQPDATLAAIMDFMGLTLPPGYRESLPLIKAGNWGKWRGALSADDQERVERIITPTLVRLGYKWDTDEHGSHGLKQKD